MVNKDMRDTQASLVIEEVYIKTRIFPSIYPGERLVILNAGQGAWK